MDCTHNKFKIDSFYDDWWIACIDCDERMDEDFEIVITSKVQHQLEQEVIASAKEVNPLHLQWLLHMKDCYNSASRIKRLEKALADLSRGER